MSVFAPISTEPQPWVLRGAQAAQDFEKSYMLNALLKKYGEAEHEAEIGLKKGQTYENYGRGQHYFAEASTAPARVNLLNSQAGHYNALTKYIPEEMDLKREQLRWQQQRFGAAYQFRQALNSVDPATRAKYIANNPDAYANMLEIYGNAALDYGTPAPPGVSPNALNMNSSPTGTNGPILNALTMPLGIPGTNAQMMNNGIAPQNISIPPPAASSPMRAPIFPPRFSTTPQIVNDLKNVSEMAANKDLTTAATRRQMEGAIQVENIINDPGIQSQALNAAQYAGAARKGKAALDALSQKNPAAYEDYLAFKNQTMVLLQNRIKTLDQMGATDKQREELSGLYTKTMDSLTSNPSQFIKQFNKLGTTLNTVAQSVQKSASPVANVNRLSGFKPLQEDGRVNIVAPDGRTGSIPASQLQEALKAGYKEG